jgi:hypothetical protein
MTTTIDITPRQVCKRAAEIIRERGWCQHRFESSDGRVCLTTALAKSCTEYGVELSFVYPLVKEAAEGQRLTQWNDRPWRTKLDTLALLHSVDR